MYRLILKIILASTIFNIVLLVGVVITIEAQTGDHFFLVKSPIPICMCEEAERYYENTGNFFHRYVDSKFFNYDIYHKKLN